MAGLPSGRTLVLRAEPGREEIEVRSPSRDMELSVVLTPAGPVVRLRAARLELSAEEEIALRCKRLEVAATEGARLGSGGDLELLARGEARVRTDGDIRMNGAFIRLNCTDDGEAARAALEAGRAALEEASAAAGRAPSAAAGGPASPCGHDH